MSLRAFHKVFIFLSICLTMGFGFWAAGPGGRAPQSFDGAAPPYGGASSVLEFRMGVASFAASFLLSAYLFWFIQKKRIGG